MSTVYTETTNIMKNTFSYLHDTSVGPALNSLTVRQEQKLTSPPPSLRPCPEGPFSRAHWYVEAPGLPWKREQSWPLQRILKAPPEIGSPGEILHRDGNPTSVAGLRLDASLGCEYIVLSGLSGGMQRGELALYLNIPKAHVCLLTSAVSYPCLSHM